VSLILVRHGETVWNREGRIQGHGDSALTARGRAQASALARRLALEPIVAVFCSDLGRARQTAVPIAGALHLEIQIRAELRERSYGVFEGKTWAEIEREHPADAALQRARDPDHVIPLGESVSQFRTRVLGALARIAVEGGGATVAVITHGGVLDVVYREIMGIPLRAARTYALPNAALNQVRYVAGRWESLRWGDSSHLEARAPGEP
jgi:probable phosphoglycerate mutase